MKKLLILALLFVVESALAENKLNALTQCLDSKLSKLNNHHSMVFAVINNQKEIIKYYGQAHKDQLYEIGSITKTFTGLLTAQAVLENKIKLDEAIPQDYQINSKPMTYKQLATHSSGLKAGNFANYCPDKLFPYEGLDRKLFLKMYETTNPVSAKPGEKFIYSNIAVGLQGLLLDKTFGRSYESLVESEILDKLEMKNTYFEVPLHETQNFTQARLNQDFFPFWDLYKTQINAAGGLRSTIGDMVKYTRAHLDPRSTELKDYIEMAQKPYFKDPESGTQIGLNILSNPSVGLYGHAGSTIGFSSYFLVSQKLGLGVIAMTNTAVYNGQEPLSLCDDSLTGKDLDWSFTQSVQECFMAQYE